MTGVDVIGAGGVVVGPPPVSALSAGGTLPKRTSVAIVGGGIIGVSTAFFLAQKGVPSLVCEKGRLAGEQSSRNWGWCRQAGRDPDELPLMLESIKLWRQLDSMVGGETGYRETGILQLCDTQGALQRCVAWQKYARAAQIATDIVRPEKIPTLVGPTARRWAGALYSPSDGRAEPQLATTAIARAAQRAGAVVVENCAVRGIETSGGRVSAVVTEQGTVACDAVVVAGGAWSRLFCGNFGVDLPALRVMTSVVKTAAVEGAPECAAIGPGFAFRRASDNSYVISQANRNVADVGPDSFKLLRAFSPVLRARWRKLKLRFGSDAWAQWMTPRRWGLDDESPFERYRTLDPAPYKPFADEAVRNCADAFPVFRNVTIDRMWAGFIDVTPDVRPVISDVADVPGVYLSTGFSGHGFGLGPGAGKLTADLVLGDTPVVDARPFNFNRLCGAQMPRPSPLAV
ncbi:NAD(P)/FAD-dependent oxidoreductase [Pseudorhodoplanes sp.]|uniref:NAD(P)/FAD-dependent oxidoreductase n=1 Tax=Pseudorhodoplanes sp. TaxID=1934341 RepID=UPI003D0FD980